MKELLKFVKFYKKEMTLAPLFKLLEAGFDLLVPIIVSLIIDNGIVKLDNDYAIKMCGVLILLAFLGIAVSITAQYFAAKASVGLGTKWREKLFEQVQRFSFQDLDKIHESGIVSRIANDTFQVQSGVNLFLRLALRSPFIVLGSCLMAFWIDAKIGMIFAVAIFLIGFVIFRITKFCVPQYEKIQDKKDAILNRTKESLEGAKVIRAFGMEDEIYLEFQEENLAYTNWQKKVSKIASFTNPLNYAIVNLGIVAILAIGGKQVYYGVLSQGQVVALYNYMSQILLELVKLANLLLLFPKVVVSAKRMADLLETKSSMQNGKEMLEGQTVTLEFEKVYLDYTGDEKYSLEDISFKAKTGEMIGIIGGTGSGKTSIVNLIPRFYEVSSGEIKINGKNIKDYDLKNVRENVGIVMQDKVLFRGTIRENIAFGSGFLDDSDIENALRIAQAKEFVEQKEQGLNELVEENGKNFSGGQRQRLTIARTIANNPKILILDDSMSALDLMTDKKLREALEELKRNKLLIIVSQRIATIKNLAQILVVDHGKIVGQGRHEELLENCQVYQEIYASQVKEE